MLRSINKIFHPVWVQQANHEKGFEGWYYRLVSADHRHSLALIPGIRRGEQEEAFLQILVQGWEKGLWISYPMDAFSSSDRPFEIALEDNRFSMDQIRLRLKESHDIYGDVSITNPMTFPVSLRWPGIMGWYRYVPKMECYHGVVITDAELEGSFSIHGQDVDFTGGRLYMEKDWGTSFPSAWVWVQSNQFKQQQTSFMLSVADIPWRGSSFTGFICYLQTPEKMYRFATYTGAEITYWEEHEKGIHLTLEDRKHRLNVRIHRSAGAHLRAPFHGEMSRMIKETVTGKVDLWLELQNGERILSCNGDPAAIEQVGELKTWDTEVDLGNEAK